MKADPERQGEPAPLVFVGRLDESDVAHVVWCQGLVVYPRPWRLACSVIVPLLAAALAATAFKRPEFARGSWALAGILVAHWVVMLTLPHALVWYARWGYRRRPEKFVETRVSLGEDGVTVENELRAYSVTWGEVGLVADTPEGLLFCKPDDHGMFWLPERLIGPDDLRGRVLALARRSGVPIRLLS